MKRRVLSFIIALALCLNLFPAWALAGDAGTGDGLCPHHPVHTDACGYAAPVLEQECTHIHDDGCYTAATACIHEHTAECYPDSGDASGADGPSLCTHVCSQESGCVTKVLSCPHVHDGACGYAAESPGAPCMFDCPICPIEDLIGELPASVSMRNIERVQVQLSEIYALYDELTVDEQRQVDLSPCAALLDQMDQMTGMGPVLLSDDPLSEATKYKLDGNTNSSTVFSVTTPTIMITNGYTLTALQSSAIAVSEGGRLEIVDGAVRSMYGAGVEVESGCSLSIPEPGTNIEGTTYALDIESGAEVRLSAGTYYGMTAAIRAADGDYDALLEPGCAYFDPNGNPIPLTEVASYQRVTVGRCADHSLKKYRYNDGTTTHAWTCLACGTSVENEKCTFVFGENTTASRCEQCGDEISIAVDESALGDLIYNGANQTANVTLTVSLKDGTLLTKGTDYTVDYSARADVGAITVTVTGVAFNGTFTKTYYVKQDQPGIKWDAVTQELDYDGTRATIKGELPHITITITAPNNEDLHPYIQYCYRETGGTEFTGGLPLDAGTYQVKAYLPESQNYKAAETDPLLTLTIKPIDPVPAAPVAAKPTYNGAAQALVTAGTVDGRAVGAEILFATSENGPWSADIPTGVNAGDSYQVWYKVEGTGNYNAVGPTKIEDVEIKRKSLTPDVTLSDYTYLYDGGFKEPTVTVKDEELHTVLPAGEYQVDYQDNRNVGTAKVVVTDKTGGNYDIIKVEVPFRITLRTQETLTITNKPGTFTYGDKFTLQTSGGSGDGLVTWEIVSGQAQVGQSSGQVIITGHGEITVKATKSGTAPNDAGVVNYEDATAVWTFTADKKPVTATVTADDKTYDGDAAATVHAKVESGVLAGDEITIIGLTGTFDNENAGVDKTVTVDTTGATISGKNSEHYNVSYSSTTVKATIYKAVADITAEPTAANLTYNGTAQTLIAAGAVVDPSSVSVEYALSENGPYSTDFPKGTDAGAYTVWYRIQETPNYTGLAPASVDATISKKPVSPTITLAPDTFVYDGTAKEPVVTLYEADGTTQIPAGEYTVAYSNNINVSTVDLAATVTVTAKADGNYTFENAPVTATFTITKEQAKVITAPKAAGLPLVFSTYAQELVTAGAGTGGMMVYSVDNENGTYLADIPTKTNAGSYTVYYKVQGDANHSDSDVGHVEVTIAPKTVKDPTITLFDENRNHLVSYTYDGSAKTPTVEVKDGSTLIDAVEYDIRYDNNIDAGNTATVNIIDMPGGNYTVTGSATFVIQKADIVFNPAPSAANITYDGKPHELLVPGTASGGTVQYALNSATSTYNDAIPTGSNAGDYTVYYRVLGDKNHNDLNDLANQKVEVTIRRKPLTDVTIELTPGSFEYDGTVKMPAVAVKDGKTVLPEEEYTWTCDVASPINQGIYTITVSDAQDGNYDLNGVTANTATFTIGQATQAPLVIEGRHEQVYYGDTFTLTTSGGSSSSAVTWIATGAATVGPAAGEVKITGVGEVTITATNPGDGNYLPVSDQWTFTAAPKPVTASVVVNNKDYDGTTAATVDSADITTINGDTVTIDPASITAAFDTPHAGTGKTVTLDASKVQVTGDTAKYAISYPGTVTADITPATTTITTAPEKIDLLTYSGQPQALVTAGQTNVGFLVYSLDGTNFSPEIPTGTNAGTYSVYYKVDETTDYTGVAVNGTPISVTIAPKSITPKVELSESSYLYDGTTKDPKVTVKDEKTVIDPDQYTVEWANVDSSVTGGLLTAAGTYKATITNVANGNYSFTAYAQVEIVAAAQGALDITGKPEHIRYGDTVTTLRVTGGSGNGTVKWSIAPADIGVAIDPDTGVLTVRGTGFFTVTAERTVPNYATATGSVTFTVEPKPVVAAVTITPKDYDGTTSVADVAITATVSDLVDPGTDSFTISGLTGVYEDANAGTGKVITLDASHATATADTAKYTVIYPTSATGAIDPRDVTVTVTLSGNDLQQDGNGDFYTFDGTDKTPAVKVVGTDATSYNAVLAASDYNVNYANNKNVGNATVTVTAKTGGNYTFTEKKVTFAIRKAGAALISSPQAKDLTYDGTAQELVTVGAATGGTVMYSKTGADGSYEEAIPKETAAGTYTVYYKVKGDVNHEDTAPGQTSVTIKPKEITPAITLDQTTYVYDGTARTPAVTVKDDTYTIDATEYSVSYRDNVNAGMATVTVSDKNGGNYIVNGTATFEITRAVPTVTDPTGKTGLQYNGELQDLVNAGVTDHGIVVYSVNGGNYSSAIPVGTAVGTYTVDWKVLGDANHSDTNPASLSVEIAKNTVTNPTISLSSDTFKYNGSQQKPTVTVYDGSSRVIPEREYEVTITGTNGNVGMVDVDTYTVTVTTPSASNYVIEGNNTRTFEIVPADQEAISITGAKAQVYYGDAIQLGATGGTGSGTITWTVTANDSSTISSTISGTGLLTVKDVNTPITVKATRSRDGNYKDATATWEFTAGEKPVTAVLTGVDRNYIAGDKTATVTATVPNSELVSGDSITISGLTGEFDDPNVGTDKRVTVNSSNPTVTGTNWKKYEITYPATATASILAVVARVDTAPVAVPSLTYDASQAQALVTAGAVTGGVMVYSLDGVNFTPAIPKAKDAGTHKVYYKAQGDGNHTDSAVGTKDVTIGKQPVTPTVELTPPGAQYDGNVKRPEAVTVRDAANNVIPENEYTIVYDPGTNWKDVGDHTVRVQNIAGGNYDITEATAEFKISITAQNPLTIVNKPGLVYYGDTFTLSATGGSGSGAIEWNSSDKSIADIDANGFVTIKGTGSATITVTKAGGGNYDEATAAYPLNALEKPVTAIVTADDKEYDGNTNATIHVMWEKGALVGTDTIDTKNLVGTFDNADVGTGKTVTITGTPVSDATAQKYDITIPATTTASILKAVAETPNVAAVSNLEYTGSAQTLVTGGTANTLYSGSRDGVYSATVPTGTDAGTYTVWYKENGDGNHNDSEPKSCTAVINPKPLTADASNVTLSGNDLQKDADGKYWYAYDGTEKKPTVTIQDGSATIPAGEYTVSYSDNKNVTTTGKEATVTITDSGDGNYIVNGSVTFEIRKGGAELTKSPEARDLTYTGQPQELVTVGAATGGHIEYSLDGGAYSTAIPKADLAKTYTVNYKVVGDDNHEDDPTVGSVTVTIKPKEVVSPKVTVSGGPYTYDGNPQVPADSAVTVTDGADTIPGTEYALSFRDNVNAGTATVIITNANGGNYIVNGTGSFTIDKANVAASDIAAPTGKTGLPYNNTEQELAEAGSASGGTMVYSLTEDGEYSPAIPTGKAVDTYTFWYKVQGDSNHTDTGPQSVTASIIVNSVNAPTIQVTPESATYNGEKQEPTVTVKDDSGLLIDGSEYEVTYAASDGNDDLTKVGKYTVTIKNRSDSNYIINDSSKQFEILAAGQTPLTITGTRERVYYGDTIQLGTTGGNGDVTWDVGGSTIAEITTGGGLLTVKGVGSVTVTATSTATGYEDQTATWTLYAEKKPVTAIVTAAAKTYDGSKTATVTATLQDSGLIAGDDVVITLEGSFEDANVGTNKNVTIDRTKTNISGSDAGKYDITYPNTVTASILKADITAADVTPPAPVADLKYTGLPQPLVTEGTATGGTMEYSLDGKTYSASLPTGTGAGDYEVWYRVKGDGNHNDTAGEKLGSKVTIAPQKVTDPIIEFTPESASYDGAVHKPAVTVKDVNHRVIPAEEYTVAYGGTDWKTAGNHEVTITDKAGGNYEITEKKATFVILAMGQNPLSIVGQPGAVRYGDSFTLSTTGGSGTGAVTWNSSDASVATIDQNGLVKVLKSGASTITATKQADGNYGAVSVTWSFSAEKKTVTPIVTAKDKVYDENDHADLVITWRDGDLLNGDTIELKGVLTGTFNDANVGTGKTVTITGAPPTSDKYYIKIPTSTTASITPKAAVLSGTTPTELTYTGSAQALVTGVTATYGAVAYSTDGSYYTLLVPTATDAGTYPVWYKAQASGNYTDSAAVRVNVTIKPKTVNTPTIDLSPTEFDYDGTPKKPDVVVKDGSTVIPASEYTVGYSNNTAVGTTATVTITDNAGGNYTVNGSANFTIKAGTPVVVTPPEPKEGLAYTGKLQTLVTRGAAANGHMMYCLDNPDGSYKTTIPTAKDADTYYVWYKVVSDDGTSETDPDYVEVEIAPQSVTPTVLLNNQYSYSTPYTGSAQQPSVTVKVGSQTLDVGTYTFSYSKNTNVGTAEVIVESTGGNYEFFKVVTFEITKGKAAFVAGQEPKAVSNLVYTGEPQKLVTAGASTHGLVLYSTNAFTFDASIPTGIEKGQYTVYAKVQGSATYEESDVVIITVEIGANVVSDPEVILSQSSFSYTGSEIRPTVTVTDDSGKTISPSEYTVSYGNNTNEGTANVTVTSKGINYSFPAKTVTFQILPAGQTPLTITGKQDTVYYGDKLYLGATGGSGDGAVTWSASGPVDRLGDGQYKITSSGNVTITATKAASGSYGESRDAWTFYAKPKPVTAVVTAASRQYNNGTNVDLTVTLSSGLVSGDVVDTVTATGHFTDASVGENKTVVIDGLTIPDEVSAKYDISWPATTTASITPKTATVTETPKAAAALIYNGSPQALLASGGTADGGELAYSLDGGSSYSYNLPTAVDAGSYTIWYKVVAGDENHKDSAPAKVGPVTISANTDAPSVLCTPDQFRYDGTTKTPTVVVRDSAQRIIPESEYTVTLPSDRIAVNNTYTVTVTDKPGGNYEFTTPATGTFAIVAASQNPLSIITDKPKDVFYGETFRLSVMGGSGGGAIKWSIKEANGAASIDDNGVVTVKGKGGFTVEAYKEASDGYDQSNTASVPFEAKPKPVTPVVTIKPKDYDGNTSVASDAITATVRPSDLVSGDSITITGLQAVYDSANAGTNKLVSLIHSSVTVGGVNGERYHINWPDGVTGAIDRVDVKVNIKPAAVTGLTYQPGTAQALVTPGSTVGNIGTIEYSLSQNGGYSEDIPTATDVGKYFVWYRVADSVNYMGFTAGPIEVEIVAPPAGDSADISDTILTPPESTYSMPSQSANSTPTQTTVQDGAASTVVSAADGDKLVQEAAESRSETIVIQPEIDGGVTRTQVTIPASTVEQIQRETNASLTVSTPIADAAIPREALDALSSAGGDVSVAAEQAGQSVVLTLTAGGETVKEVPGGLTLTVPAADAGPGAVAVLVHDDGTREILPKSMAADGKMNIPLNGSATVEIVDNSKSFDDVPSDSWAAGAVAFVSARELFGGTSETTFSPDQAMSRAMVASVLYRLEGQPEQAAASAYSDVSDDDWYAAGVSWAAENGIVSGYGDGQFGPNDSVTREQFIVMLWRYAGSPEANDRELSFSDADQVSGYAKDALCWAVESGVLGGSESGRIIPGESATRAEAAQMLKNFMEST